MNSMRKIVLAIAISSISVAALGQSAKPAVSPEIEAALKRAAKIIAAWGHDPVLVREVKEQNARHMTMAEIQAIDKAWTDGGEAERANQLLSNPCAAQLKKLVAAHPAFGESFVMDDQGGNVCMTNRTSDYWQGDEAKWQKSFNNGQGTVFIDEPRYDTSAKAILAQISVAVFDGEKTIGAITVGVKPELIAPEK